MDTPLVEDVVLAGRYRLRSLLGTGGMAQVYDGWDERLARPVAVKLLRADLAAVADLRRRFEMEARAAARLSHPNVVSVFDAGEDNGRSFIVMERLRGESLADSIGHGPVDGAWLRRLAGEVLSALGAAHAAGIVHRDIKPGNILLGPDGRAKVADFGIARVVESPAIGERGSAETALALTGAGLVVGTPAYLAPERAMGEPATPQSDLYSLGVVLYEALTGRKPYTGNTPAAIAAAAVQGAVQNPLLLRPDADADLVRVIGRAMALDPSQRYPSAAEMAADLQRPAPPRTEVMPALVAPTVPNAPEAAAEAAAVAALVAPTVADAPHPLRTRPDPVRTRPAGAGDRYRGPATGPSSGRRWLVALGGAALLLIAVVVANAGTGGGANTPPTSAASATTLTTAAGTPATSPSATTPPTTPAAVGSGQNDPLAVALQALVRRLSGSKSAAAGGLAAGLSNVAAIADPSARAAAASSLLDQTVQWYQQGQLTTSEYVIAGALLHSVGAPQAPPPTVKRSGTAAGGAGGGGD